MVRINSIGIALVSSLSVIDSTAVIVNTNGIIITRSRIIRSICVKSEIIKCCAERFVFGELFLARKRRNEFSRIPARNARLASIFAFHCDDSSWLLSVPAPPHVELINNLVIRRDVHVLLFAWRASNN